MECKYTKYTVLEVVPIELKSYNTPLYTIWNSILLWIFLGGYYIYTLGLALKNKVNGLKNLFAKKYEHKGPHLETEAISEDMLLTDIEILDLDIKKSKFIKSESEVFVGKGAKKIFDYLFEDKEVLKTAFEKIDLRLLGNFSLRKDIIYFEAENEDICNKMKDKIILTRSHSKPVKVYLDFMLKKII